MHVHFDPSELTAPLKMFRKMLTHVYKCLIHFGVGTWKQGARKELKGGVAGSSDPGSMGIGPCVAGPTINPSSTVLQ